MTAKTRLRTESEKEGTRGTIIIIKKKYKTQYTVPAHTIARCVSSRWHTNHAIMKVTGPYVTSATYCLSVCLSLRYLWSPIRQANEKILMNATNTTEELVQIWAIIIRSVRRRLFHEKLEKHTDMKKKLYRVVKFRT